MDFNEQLTGLGSAADNGDGLSEDKRDPFLSSLYSHTDKMRDTVMKFTEMQAIGTFILLNFDERKIGALAQFPNGLYNLQELEGTQYQLNNYEEKLEKLDNYFNNYMNDVTRLFKINKKQLPRNIWCSHNFTRPGFRQRVLLNYADYDWKILSLEDGLAEWQDILNATGWFNMQV